MVFNFLTFLRLLSAILYIGQNNTTVPIHFEMSIGHHAQNNANLLYTNMHIHPTFFFMMAFSFFCMLAAKRLVRSNSFVRVYRAFIAYIEEHVLNWANEGSLVLDTTTAVFGYSVLSIILVVIHFMFLF